MRPASFLMLFLVMACPVVREASLSAPPIDKGNVDRCSNSSNDPCRLRNDQESPRSEQPCNKPCNNTTCFCSQFVMHETSGNQTHLIDLTDCPAMVVPDDLSNLIGFQPIRESWERHIFPSSMTETAGVLPLLI